MIFVREERSRGVSVLYIRGHLRTPLSAALRENVGMVLRRGARMILLNLAGVTALDAAGVGELVHVYNITTARRGVLRVTDAPARVGELLDRARLSDVLSADPERWWLEAVRRA